MLELPKTPGKTDCVVEEGAAELRGVEYVMGLMLPPESTLLGILAVFVWAVFPSVVTEVMLGEVDLS